MALNKLLCGAVFSAILVGCASGGPKKDDRTPASNPGILRYECKRAFSSEETLKGYKINEYDQFFLRVYETNPVQQRYVIEETVFSANVDGQFHRIGLFDVVLKQSTKRNELTFTDGKASLKINLGVSPKGIQESSERFAKDEVLPSVGVGIAAEFSDSRGMNYSAKMKCSGVF